MVLSLNLECEGELYREFYGRIIDQIPLLLASGRVPLSTKQLMERRIEVRDADFGKQYKGTAHEASIQAVRDSIWTNYFDTGDGVLYHPDGKIKVVVNAPFLRSLNPESKLSNGALVLSDELYAQTTDAPEFTREQVEKERFATVWLALAQDDTELLKEYRKAVAEELKTRYNYEGQNMNVFLAPAKNVTTGRSCCVNRCGDGSNADGNGDLDGGDGRLVGVVPEAQGLVARSASPECFRKEKSRFYFRRNCRTHKRFITRRKRNRTQRKTFFIIQITSKPQKYL